MGNVLLFFSFKCADTPAKYIRFSVWIRSTGINPLTYYYDFFLMCFFLFYSLALFLGRLSTLFIFIISDPRRHSSFLTYTLWNFFLFHDKMRLHRQFSYFVDDFFSVFYSFKFSISLVLFLAVLVFISLSNRDFKVFRFSNLFCNRRCSQYSFISVSSAHAVDWFLATLKIMLKYLNIATCGNPFWCQRSI